MSLRGQGVILNPAETGVYFASTGSLGNNHGSLLTIDITTGAGTMIGSTGLTRIPGLAINSSGDIYATSRSAEAVLYRIDAGTGSAVFVGIEDAEKLIPKECALEQNYPNPFNLSTTISYSIEHSGAVQFKIYNALGQLMRTLVNEEKYGGEYTVVWD